MSGKQSENRWVFMTVERRVIFLLLRAFKTHFLDIVHNRVR